MILLTRLNGPQFALNPDLFERADCTPDTVITLVDGTKYVVSESLTDLVGLIRTYRASIIAEAQRLVHQDASGPTPARHEVGADHPSMGRAGDFGYQPDLAPAPTTHNVVPLHRRER